MKKLYKFIVATFVVILCFSFLSIVQAATETKWASSHITGDFDNPDNALGASDGVWAGDVNVNDGDTSRWAMEDPSGSITGTQTISVLSRKGSNSGDPTIAINLYENGSLVQSVVGNTSVTSTSGQTVSGTFDASVITNASNVEIEVVMTSAGGSPGARNSAQIDSIEWTVNLPDASGPTVTTNAETSVGNTAATLNGEITATGGNNATERGFAWGTVSTLSGGDTSTTTESGSFGTGTFNQSLSNLLSGVTYYYRAYATNSSGIGYGSIGELTTGTDTGIRRSMRLFESFRIRLFQGTRLRIFQQ